MDAALDIENERRDAVRPGIALALLASLIGHVVLIVWFATRESPPVVAVRTPPLVIEISRTSLALPVAPAAPVHEPASDVDSETASADPPAEPAVPPRASTESLPAAGHSTPQPLDLRLPPGFRVAPYPAPKPDGATGRIFDPSMAERLEAARSARPTPRPPDVVRSWASAQGHTRIETAGGCYERRNDSQDGQPGEAWLFISCGPEHTVDWGERFRRQP